MPEKARSSRTVLVKRPAWDFAGSEREKKAETEMGGLSAPRPVLVRNQSWAQQDEGMERRKSRQRKNGASFAMLKEWAARSFGDKTTSRIQIVAEELECKSGGWGGNSIGGRCASRQAMIPPLRDP